MLNLYPKAHIIASADIKLGLINTGFLVFRNTPWTRDFVRRWWTITDKNKHCDQDAFDILYKQLLANGPSEGLGTGSLPEIKILSTDAINSHPPAWKYHAPTNAVLHLMGETAWYRASIFRKSFQSICSARSGGVLPTHLGITTSWMQEEAR